MNVPDIPDGTSKAEAALLYARAGIPVFPCGADKAPIGKLAPNGFLSQTTDEATIKRWWGEYPDANPASAFDEHTLVLDVDDPRKWQDGGIVLPHSGPVQTTANSSPDNPRRQHFYDVNGADPKGLITTLPEFGAETKGLNRGYVLLPPSTALRKDGITMGDYRWVRTGEGEAVPEPVEAALRARRAKTPPTSHTGSEGTVITVTGGQCANWCDRTGPIPRDPGGHDYMNKYLVHRVTYHKDTQPDILFDALLPLLSRMDPEYPPGVGLDTIKKIADQMVKDIADGDVKPDGETNISRDIGTATANDLPQGAPPDLLLSPWLHPEGTTTIYGPGGVGKGITAAWLTQGLVAAGHTVMVLDYEFHPREWGNRLDGLQMNPDEKDHVHYRAPYGPDWAAKTGTLIEVWDLVREDADDLGVTFIVVDSYTPATGDDDRMGGQGAAQQFAQAASRLGRPMLVLAHVASAAGRFPDKPFGSVHVRNLVARRQWAVESNGETLPAHPLTEPSVIKLEFRNTKGNDYAKAKPRHVTVSFWPLGLITVVDEEETKPNVEFLIDSVLDRPLTVKAIRAAIGEDFPDIDLPSEGVIDVTLRRTPEKYTVDRAGKRPFPWSLASTSPTNAPS